jgi:hypothetical protein
VTQHFIGNEFQENAFLCPYFYSLLNAKLIQLHMTNNVDVSMVIVLTTVMFLYHHHQQQQHNDHFHHHSYCHHSHGAVSYLKTFIMFKRSKKFCFMELKGSLPRSQKPKVGPYSEPDGSILLLRFILTLSSHLPQYIPSGAFP